MIDDTGREVVWVNRFLDQERVRSVSDATLRSYAHDLLHFLRWWVDVNQTDAVTEKALTETTLLDYIRFQTNQQPRPAAASINHRVAIAERALRREFPQAQPPFVAWLSVRLLATVSAGLRTSASGAEPNPREDTQTRRGAFVGGRGGAAFGPASTPREISPSWA